MVGSFLIREVADSTALPRQWKAVRPRRRRGKIFLSPYPDPSLRGARVKTKRSFGLSRSGNGIIQA